MPSSSPHRFLILINIYHMHHCQLVPVVFRLFHENSGFWFWWGTKHATGAEFKAAWKYTVEYLRDTKVSTIMTE